MRKHPYTILYIIDRLPIDSKRGMNNAMYCSSCNAKPLRILQGFIQFLRQGHFGRVLRQQQTAKTSQAGRKTLKKYQYGLL